jgi:hypothetical protein
VENLVLKPNYNPEEMADPVRHRYFASLAVRMLEPEGGLPEESLQAGKTSDSQPTAEWLAFGLKPEEPKVVPASGKRGEIATKAQPVDIKRIKVEEPQVNIGTADPVADFARAKEIDPQASRKELAAVVQRLFSEPTGHMYGKAAKALAVLRDENCEEFATLLPVLAALGPAVAAAAAEVNITLQVPAPVPAIVVRGDLDETDLLE